MKNLLERWLIAIPVLIFLELFLLVFLLTVLFFINGPAYNNLNNSGFGNVLNAVGFVGIFYVVYGYFMVRLVTLAVALAFPKNRSLAVGIVGAVVFAVFAATQMPEAKGPNIWLWAIWAVVALANLLAPLSLPRRILA